MGEGVLTNGSLHMETLSSAKACQLVVDYKWLNNICQYLEAQDQLKYK